MKRTYGGIKMFSGNYSFTLDGKSRISIPSGYREYLLSNYNNRLTLTKHLMSATILIWPSSSYEKFLERFDELPAWDEGVEKLKRFFISWAFHQEFDNNGRLFIPTPLREYAGLNRDVVVAGAGKVIQLWSKDRWDDQNLADSANPSELKDLARRLNIRM
ncbi:MAG: division/cell wall cluster transcriptional repressor MraZ [Myxococcota bacterium]